MRFDDSLSTVLAGDLTGDAGARSAWRQLVDLVGRGRVAADAATLARMRALRAAVPVDVRAASARALALAGPPAALIAFFAEDEAAVSAPVLRTATMADADWTALLPSLDVRGRSVLRHRRDLAASVRRALESFGPADFVLGHAAPEQAESPAEIAAGIDAAAPRTPAPLPRPAAEVVPEVPVEDAPRFEIADLIARIDGFTRERPETPAPAPPADRFVFETDTAGTIRWVDGIGRAALVGLNLARPSAGPGGPDAVIAGALRRRDRFADARLEIGGDGPAAGGWRLSGVPLFDESSGRFTGMSGVARRPRRDQQAAPTPAPTAATGSAAATADSLRQLVHELRTPANAIMGFAELMEAELLGPVPVHYRARAGTIRDEAGGLLAAVEDLDTAARIEARALDLRPGAVPLAPVIERAVDELRPLAFLRGVEVTVLSAGDPLAASGDGRAVERLVSRLLAALMAAGSAGERLQVAARHEGGTVAVAIDRPQALGDDADLVADGALFSLDADAQEQPGAPLLGIGFTLRLARNLAGELGGALSVEPTRLTLRLPAAVDAGVLTAAV